MSCFLENPGLDIGPFVLVHEDQPERDLSFLGSALENAVEVDPKAAEKPLLAVFSYLSKERLSAWLVRPYSGCIQIVEGDNNPIDITHIPHSGDHSLFVSITVGAAYSFPIALVLSKGLADHVVVNEDLLYSIETALNEGISNGVLHGDLGMLGGGCNTEEALEQQGILVSNRLAEPKYRNRRLEVSVNWSVGLIDIYVCDCGQGYLAKAEQGVVGCSGRGMDLIGALSSSMEVFNGGRGLKMSFAT